MSFLSARIPIAARQGVTSKSMNFRTVLIRRSRFTYYPINQSFRHHMYLNSIEHHRPFFYTTYQIETWSSAYFSENSISSLYQFVSPLSEIDQKQVRCRTKFSSNKIMVGLQRQILFVSYFRLQHKSPHCKLRIMITWFWIVSLKYIHNYF